MLFGLARTMSAHDPDRATPTASGRWRRWRPVRIGCSATALVLATACSSGSTGAATAEPVTTAAAAVQVSTPDSTPGPTPSATPAATPSTTVARAADTTAEPAATGSSGLTSLVVESTPDQYFVLYVRPDLDAATEIPVAIARGNAGTTTLTDGRSQLANEHYRVATFSSASPGDVDGDGVDDLTELADPVNANPLNPAPPLDLTDGAVIIPDRATFETLSYQGDQVARDGYLAGLEFVKFWLVGTDKAHPSVYFMNTETYRAHPTFASAVGIPGGRGPAPGSMRGDIVYNANATAPDGSKGTYRFAFQPNDAYSFDEIALAYELLATSLPMLRNNLLYYPFPSAALPLYQKERAAYDAYRVPVLVE
jgi:hypothetical protein